MEWIEALMKSIIGVFILFCLTPTMIYIFARLIFHAWFITKNKNK